MSEEKKTIFLERGAPDRLVPKDFADILTRRFLPVLSLSYIAAVAGIAGQKGDFFRYLFIDKSAYVMALFVMLWVSIPGILWIFIRNVPGLGHTADLWYKIVAALMIVVLAMSFILFPEAQIWGLRVYGAASIPVFFVMYLFFVKGGLPAAAAHPLTALGITMLVHGALLHFLH